MPAGYWRRQLLAPTPLMVYAFLAASGLAAAAASATGNLFLLTVVTDIVMWVALAAALNIIMGYAGYVSFGHVVFMGLGGYLTALAMEYWLHGLAMSQPLLVAALAILGSAALAAAVAGAVGLAVLKLRGAFFAIATIGLDLAALYLATMLPTEEGGGEIYFSVRPSLATVTALTWLVAAATLLTALVVKKSKLGMGLEAIREDEDAAESLGVPTFRYKTVAFMISAALAGAMGAVYAWRTMSVTPGDAFNLVYSIRMIVINVIGGLGTILGPIVGGVIYYLLNLAFSTSQSLTDLTDIVMGLLAIAIVLFLPEGVIGVLRKKQARLLGRPLHRILE